MLRPISTWARYTTVGSPAAAVNVGSRDSAQFTFMTGLSHSPPVDTRSEARPGTVARAQRDVRTGSAFETHDPRRGSSSPALEPDPLAGRDRRDRHPGGDHGPGLHGGVGEQNDTRPMPPST